MKMTDATLFALSDALARGEISSAELCEQYLAEMEEKDQEIGAFLTVSCDSARAAAAECDRRRARGEAPTGHAAALFGIPYAAKDNISTRGIRTTCSSRMLAHYIPPYDATVIENLSAAGGVLLGKLNMDEFAMGSSGEHAALGTTRNPCDLSRVAGGSSCGAAAAVAAGLAPYALGSDTGGSVRLPAAFCGVVGMKPTYGTVSRYGLVAFASSLDQIGPLTRDVRGNALVLSALVAQDARDATSRPHPTRDFCIGLEDGVRGLRIGLPEEFFGDGCDEDVRRAVLRTADTLRALGAEIVPLSLPIPDVALAAYYLISSAEASSNLSRFDGVRYGHRAAEYDDVDTLFARSRAEGFGSEVKRRILSGTLVLSAGYYDQYYQKAAMAREHVKRMLADALRHCDVILSPTAPTVAHRFGERSDPQNMRLGDRYTVPASLAGLPALSLPCGRGADGLPVGAQLVGAPFSEALLYRVAYAIECESCREPSRLLNQESLTPVGADVLDGPQNQTHTHRQTAILKPPSEREGDRGAVEGACATEQHVKPLGDARSLTTCGGAPSRREPCQNRLVSDSPGGLSLQGGGDPLVATPSLLPRTECDRKGGDAS